MNRNKRQAWNTPKLIVIYKPPRVSQEAVLRNCKQEYVGMGPAIRDGACMEYMPLSGCFMPCSNQSSS
ncbi:MAG: hypothetical protein PHN59_04700 [Candidatus Omnitrophica bacterium]|nr:hypothetical protein [Candidatus Omnitrophota bacterium]